MKKISLTKKKQKLSFRSHTQYNKSRDWQKKDKPNKLKTSNVFEKIISIILKEKSLAQRENKNCKLLRKNKIVTILSFKTCRI